MCRCKTSSLCATRLPQLAGSNVAARLYFSYTIGVKTAISIPDDVYQEAEITARHLGLGRSQLYTRAIKEFIERHDKERITKKLDTLYSAEGIREDQALDVGVEALREKTRHDSW